VQVVPMPSEKEIQKLYHEDIEHFAPYIAQIPVHREYFRKKIKEINTQYAIRNTQCHLLDIGCAMGILLKEAKKAGYKAQGVDISADAVAYCRKKGFSVSQRWPTSKFDVITAFEIIEHERDPKRMMSRVYKLLNKGGLAFLTTPNHDSFWRKIMGTWWVGYHHPEHVTFWDPQSLTYLLKTSGFRNIKIQRDSPRPFPLSFVFTRGADYMPWAARILKPIGKLLDRFHLKNPINPWDDLIMYGRK
jgi:SAM-dependent methyltransferase